MLRTLVFLTLWGIVPEALAGTLRVPQDHPTIQAAIAAAEPGDVVLVAPGRYTERIALRPRITLRSAGDDAPGGRGLQRAEATILDGGGQQGEQPGVVMAEGSTLDGFTVTNVGKFDESLWKKHYDSQGEELADDEGAARAEGTIPAIRAAGVECTVVHNIVHDNGDVGIAILGAAGRRVAPVVEGNRVFRNLGGGIGIAEQAEPIVRNNACYENLRAGIGCRQSSPLLLDNRCFRNVRAGIGCREGARPMIRGNKCYQNRRAGIGIRMPGTAPLVEDNECAENALAGIGCRDGAEPVLRRNLCRNNEKAGIGCDGASPLIASNVCRDNQTAGIGIQGAGRVTIQGNECRDNALVAIGLTDGCRATLVGNLLARRGGAPPLVAILRAEAVLEDNRLEGGGVAAVLVQGQALLRSNAFEGPAGKPTQAIWVQKGATATVVGNTFRGYQPALRASQATVLVVGNTVRADRGPAFVIQDSAQPAHVVGNRLLSENEESPVVALEGPAGIVADNVASRPKTAP